MLRFELQIEASFTGWALVLIQAKDRVFKIMCSHSGGDSLRELAQAFLRLVENEHRKIEVDCFEEPGNVIIGLKRKGSELDITLTRFTDEFDGASKKLVDRMLSSGRSKDWNRVLHARNKRANLRERVSFVDAMASLAQAFQDLEDKIGCERYERQWGFSFPAAELASIRQFLSSHSLNGGAMTE